MDTQANPYAVVDKSRPPNERMLIAADEWLTGAQTGKRFNKAAACRLAGYPEQYSSTLFKHPGMKKYIEEKLEDYVMSRSEVLMRFSEIARAEFGKILRVNPQNNRVEIDPEKLMENAHLVKNFGYDTNGNAKVEFHDAHAALRDIAKALGMLKDGVEVTGPGGGAVPVSMAVRFISPEGKPLDLDGTGTQTPEIEDADWEEIENFEGDENGFSE